MIKFFEQKNIQSTPISDKLERTKNYINNTCTKALESQECFMSFYSVAKNIRFLSSYFYESIKNNKKPILSEKCRINEDIFWESITGQSWYPWLWGRHKSKSENNRISWNHFFKDFTNKEYNFTYTNNNIDIEYDDLFLYLSCLDMVFDINDDYLKELETKYINFEWPSSDVIGLQIRRGEIVKNDGNISNSWNSRFGVGNGARPIYSIDEYMDGLNQINESNVKYIFVSTDSSETIEYLEKNYKEYNFLYAKYDRNKFLRYEGNPDKVALEFDVCQNENLISHYTDSCVTDLYLLSKCQYYVGGMTYSEYGLLGWFLQMIKQKKITPYYNVEGHMDMINGDLKMLLL